MIPRFVCSHGDGWTAVAVVVTPNGCIARKDDRQQFLCAQHWHSAEDGIYEPWTVLWVLGG